MFQAITAKPVKKCPKCGKNSAERLIGAGSGIIFKGSGFYQTDYRSESYKKAAKAEKDAVTGKGKKENPGDKKKTSDSKSKGPDN
jgi:predicted nucleic acid-binding Zn ribbon protein